MKETIDLTTKVGYIKIRTGGFNPIFSPNELKEWTQIVLRTDSSNVVVSTSSGDASSGTGLSIPLEGQLSLLLGPGSTLFAGGTAGANVSWSSQQIPYLRALQYLEHLANLNRRTVDLLDKIVAYLPERLR